MKQLTDFDIKNMINPEPTLDTRKIRGDVLSKLHINSRIQQNNQPTSISEHTTLDLHNHTIEQAWSAIMALAESGIRHATIITGASGVLRQLFPQWVSESILSPYIVSAIPINNGSFAVKFHKQKQTI